jgi:hypothetical protein
MNDDPRRTLALLDELEELQFDDQSFALLHHFQNHTIAEHRRYCEMQVQNDARFQVNGTNSMVQRRLAMILDAYKGGSFSGGTKVFEALARAVLLELPVAG